MPAVTLLELAADHGLVTQERDGITLRDRIDIHAVFGKRGIQTALRRMPEKSAGSDQDERTGFAEHGPPLLEPRFNLARMFEFPLRHRRGGGVQGSGQAAALGRGGESAGPV